jgi:hypothetical protein
MDTACQDLLYDVRNGVVAAQGAPQARVPPVRQVSRA